MEWAQGIGVEGRQFVALVAREGQIESVSLDDICRRGLPSPGNTVRSVVTFNLGRLTPVGPAEYCKATGVTLPAGEPNHHQVFEVVCGQLTMVIPALVLMRALFRPTQHLLPTMFAPHALDRVCWVRTSVDGAALVIDAHWATQSRAIHFRDWVGPLSWMVAHPSGRQMADSVHANATIGTIGLAPPDAICTAVLRSVRLGCKRFVTDASLQRLQPLDAPSIQLVGLEGDVTMYANSDSRFSWQNLYEPLAMAIPQRRDGSTELSDHEWSLVEPLLMQGRARTCGTVICQRAILDGVLAKLTTGMPWRKCAFRAGTWRNAAFAHRAWSKRGCFAEVLRVLQTARL